MTHSNPIRFVVRYGRWSVYDNLHGGYWLFCDNSLHSCFLDEIEACSEAYSWAYDDYLNLVACGGSYSWKEFFE